MKKYIAELFGTFGLVFVGCGSAVFAGGHADPLTISICFGLGLTALAYFLGDISGCHVNPAVSAGFYVANRMKTGEFCGYIIAQFSGAVLGALLLALMAGTSAGGLGSNGVDAGVLAAVIYEALATFIFVSVILEVTTLKSFQCAGLIIGLTLAVLLTMGFHITGGSLNPARSMGPAVISGRVEYIWVFLLCPTIGGILAGVVHRIRHAK